MATSTPLSTLGYYEAFCEEKRWRPLYHYQTKACIQSQLSTGPVLSTFKATVTQNTSHDLCKEKGKRGKGPIY